MSIDVYHLQCRLARRIPLQAIGESRTHAAATCLRCHAREGETIPLTLLDDRLAIREAETYRKENKVPGAAAADGTTCRATASEILGVEGPAVAAETR